MAGKAMGDISPDKLNDPKPNNDITPDIVKPISKRLVERSKRTPEYDFYPLPEKIAEQQLVHIDKSVRKKIEIIKENNDLSIIGGGYNIGISGDARIDKLIQAICQIKDRQERILNDIDKGVTALLGKDIGDSQLSSFLNDMIPIVIDRKEFARVYYGKKRIGGKEVDLVSRMLFKLSTQRYLKYCEEGSSTSVIIVQPVLIPNLPIFESDGATPFLVLLNSDFAKGGKFILYPSNYLKKTQKATHMQHQLYLLLLERIGKLRSANKRTTNICKLTEKKLWYYIASEPKYDRRPKKRLEDFYEAVKNIKELGLITNYEQGETIGGEKTAIFTLNLSYYQYEVEQCSSR